MQVDCAVARARPRVLIADDHAPIRERVRGLLESGFDVVGIVTDGKEVAAETMRLAPDVIVLDISMPGMNGIQAARALRESGSNAKIVFFTVHQETSFVRRCMAEGAMGYVVKSRLEGDLIHAIDEALLGRHFISPSLRC